MKFVFLFLGKTREKYLDAGIRDYAKRLERFGQVEFIIIKERSPGKLPAEILKKQEAHQLLEKSRDAGYSVAFDPDGMELDSESLAKKMTSWEERGLRTIHFIIGGHYGLHQDVLHKADFVLSLSRMTFTHEMTRLIVLEQLYRACMIKAGRSYHN